MKIHALLSVFLIISQALAFAAGDASSGKSVYGVSPKLGLSEALEAALTFISERKIDLSDQYLHSISLRYDEAEKIFFWHLQWHWVQPKMGMEYGLKVLMDKTVIEYRCGP